MGAVMVEERLIDSGEGTSEATWLPWLHMALVTPATAAALVPEGARAVVVAPHPDDEILAVGGLLSQLAELERDICLIAVTDGTASHPGSKQWPINELARMRPIETRRALQRLGVPQEPLRLRMPDGGLAGLGWMLTDLLKPLLRPGDVLFTTWRHDGHPDHEATGHACAEAAAHVGARLVEVPVWAWHWARPGDARLPWQRACRVALGGETLRRKRRAVQAFESQLLPDPSTGADAILRQTTVARAARPFEVLFT